MTPFDVVVATDSPDFFARDPHNRLTIQPLKKGEEDRPSRFIQKISGVLNIPELKRYDKVMLIDADAVVVAPISGFDIEKNLAAADFALVEQKMIRGSSMNRQRFFEHFCRYALPAIAPLSKAKDFPRFRYWNSGVVFARTEPLVELAKFVERGFSDGSALHSPEGELVGDQDYFQYWLGREAGPRFRELPIEWNDCYWWNPEFPSPQSRIVHFSSFTQPPDQRTIQQMSEARSSTELQVVVVSHDSEQALDGCLRSIPPDVQPPIVIDNASTDRSKTVAAEAGAIIYQSNSNRGFAKAVNYLFDLVSSEFVCVLTPDSSPSEDYLRDAVQTLRQDPNALAVVPEYLEPDGSLARGVRPGYTFRQLVWEIVFPEWRSDRASQALTRLLGIGTAGWTWPCCACVVFRRDSFLEIGGFDPDFFLYMEDVELGRRAARAGWTIVESSHRVEHATSTSSQVSANTRKQLLTDARVKFAEKEFGRLHGQVARLARKLSLKP